MTKQELARNSKELGLKPRNKSKVENESLARA